MPLVAPRQEGFYTDICPKGKKQAPYKIESLQQSLTSGAWFDEGSNSFCLNEAFFKSAQAQKIEKSSEEEKKVLSKSIESGLDEKKSFPKSLILERRLKWEKKKSWKKNFHKKIFFYATPEFFWIYLKLSKRVSVKSLSSGLALLKHRSKLN